MTGIDLIGPAQTALSDTLNMLLHRRIQESFRCERCQDVGEVPSPRGIGSDIGWTTCSLDRRCPGFAPVDHSSRDRNPPNHQGHNAPRPPSPVGRVAAEQAGEPLGMRADLALIGTGSAPKALIRRLRITAQARR